MTWKELKQKVENVSATDEAKIAVLFPDGTLDYAVIGWVTFDDSKDGTIVISGN